MTLTRTLAAAVLATALALGAAHAATEAPYDQAAVTAAQQAGKPVLLHVTAPWCPVCKQQKPILAKLLEDPAYKDLQVFDIDFDTQKDLLRTLGVQKQSTFIAFHGTKEEARSTGVTDPAAIQALVAKTNG